MPELPEVETIAQGLQQPLQNKIITGLQILNESSVVGSKDRFCTRVQNRVIQRVYRRGKLLLLDLDQGLQMAFHLRMTGRILLQERPVELNSHSRLVFDLDCGQQLVFEDKRKFGYCALCNVRELQTWPFYARMGPEPLVLSPEDFVHLFHAKKARIKALLLDQQFIAGIGNIYADESLHLAGIHPACPADALQEKHLYRLYHALQQVLNKAIQCKGTSLRDYVDSLGNPGGYQDGFWAYGRRAEPCRQCGAILQSTKVAGRSSVFCPHCQDAPARKLFAGARGQGSGSGGPS